MAKRKQLSPIRATIFGSTRYARTDTRARKCYSWEWNNVALLGRDKKLSRDVAKGIARLCAKVGLARLQAKHGLSVEKVEKLRATFKAKFTTERQADALAIAGINGCWFGADSWSGDIIAHEVAHWLDMKEADVLHEFGQRTGHGPKWLGWYVFLLEEVLKIDRVELVKSLAKAGLRYERP